MSGSAMVSQKVNQLRREFMLPVQVNLRGPVALQRFFEELAVSYVAIPGLNCGKVVEHLLAEGSLVNEFDCPDEPLAGFLYFTGDTGIAFVDADDILPRRRFSAAHELGHAVLHRAQMGSFRADSKQTMLENDASTDQIEREANQFAAELLIPESVVFSRRAEIEQQYGICTSSVLIYRLSAELLVSREAMRNRLKNLGVVDG